MSSMVTPDFDDKLKQIAMALYKKEDIDKLGKALGFGLGDIGRCIDANAQQGGTYMGTLEMLRKWRNGQKASTEIEALRSALLQAGLSRLVDQYLLSYFGRPQNPSDLSQASPAAATCDDSSTTFYEEAEVAPGFLKYSVDGKDSN